MKEKENENESKKITANVTIKDILAEIEKGPDYMKKVVYDFQKDCKTLIRSMTDLYKEHIIINHFGDVSFKFELYGFGNLLMKAEVGNNTCKRKDDKDTYTNVTDVLLEALKNAETEDNID